MSDLEKYDTTKLLRRTWAQNVTNCFSSFPQLWWLCWKGRYDVGRLILSPSKRGNSTKNENLPQPALLIHRWISRKEERGVEEGLNWSLGNGHLSLRCPQMSSHVPQMSPDVQFGPFVKFGHWGWQWIPARSYRRMLWDEVSWVKIYHFVPIGGSKCQICQGLDCCWRLMWKRTNRNEKR